MQSVSRSRHVTLEEGGERRVAPQAPRTTTDARHDMVCGGMQFHRLRVPVPVAP